MQEKGPEDQRVPLPTMPGIQYTRRIYTSAPRHRGVELLSNFPSYAVSMIYYVSDGHGPSAYLRILHVLHVLHVLRALFEIRGVSLTTRRLTVVSSTHDSNVDFVSLSCFCVISSAGKFYY